MFPSITKPHYFFIQKEKTSAAVHAINGRRNAFTLTAIHRPFTAFIIYILECVRVGVAAWWCRKSDRDRK